MQDFALLKEKCEKKLQEVKPLVQELSTDLIFKDINRFMDKTPERLVYGQEGVYILDGKIGMNVTGEGCLNIRDDRATAYGWTFDVGFKEGFRVGEWFEHEGRLYSISRLKEDSFAGTCEMLEKIDKELDGALKLLKENKGNLDFWNYTYSSEKEDIVCNSFEQVIETVISRKPIYR